MPEILLGTHLPVSTWPPRSLSLLPGRGVEDGDWTYFVPAAHSGTGTPWVFATSYCSRWPHVATRHLNYGWFVLAEFEGSHNTTFPKRGQVEDSCVTTSAAPCPGAQGTVLGSLGGLAPSALSGHSLQATRSGGETHSAPKNLSSPHPPPGHTGGLPRIPHEERTVPTVLAHSRSSADVTVRKGEGTALPHQCWGQAPRAQGQAIITSVGTGSQVDAQGCMVTACRVSCTPSWTLPEPWPWGGTQIQRLGQGLSEVRRHPGWYSGFM
jgi:hypothetical protein